MNRYCSNSGSSRPTVLRRAFRNIFKDRKGSLTVYFALSMVGVVGLVGAAVDVSMLAAVKMRMQSAADSATLSGARTLLDDVKVKGTDHAERYYPEARTSTANTFTANVQTEKSLTNVVVTATTASYKDNAGTVTLSATAHYAPVLMKMFGIKDIPLNVSSTATSGAAGGGGKYYQIAFLIDTSESMAVGGTEDDIRKSIATFGCEFACHDLVNTVGIGRARGIKFKIDYAREAINALLGQFSGSAGGDAHVSVGLYTFSDSLHALAPPTSDLSSVAALVPTLDVDVVPPHFFGSSIGHTNITGALNDLRNTLPRQGGDGSSAGSPLTLLIMITDGAEDPFGMPLAGFADGNWGSACAPFKNNNATVYLIDTYYYPFAFDPIYNLYVEPNMGAIDAAFKQCASSPTDVFLATDGPGIVAAVKLAAQKVMTASLRVSK